MESTSLNTGWIFLGKDSLPGIERKIPFDANGEAIQLPHRLPFANHSFWYKTTVNIDPGFLLIDADDSTQLRVNGFRFQDRIGQNFLRSQIQEKKNYSSVQSIMQLPVG